MVTLNAVSIVDCEVAMFVVMFEVQPRPDQWDTYLGLAKWLRPEIEQIDGFIDNERFASRRTTGRLLSLSTWRDEKALIRWRTLAVHHGAQERGRTAIFADYHLRIGEVTDDTSAPAGQPLGHDRFDLTAASATAATIVEVQASPLESSDPAYPGAAVTDYAGAAGLVDVECFDSITTPAKMLVVAAWRDAAGLAAWQATRPLPPPAPLVATPRCRAVRIIRDYGMRDRAEAPQYYPPPSGD
jgi:heme-degrading monooxygenase HmoA